MSKRQFTRLKTTTGDYLEIGTRIRQEGTPLFGTPMAPIEGVISKMVGCDSGILLHIDCTGGEVGLAHVQSFPPGGVAMNNEGITVTVLNRAQHQLEIMA